MEDKNDKIVRQNNLLTTARYRMSALEKDIIYMMLSQLKADDTWERQYEIPIRMFQEKKGVRIRREELLSAAKKLISRGLTIYYEDQKKFITIGILVSADYGEEEKKNHLILGFDPKLYPFLTNLKQRFTTYRLQAALTLKSKHSKRLYEMFSQFKDTGVMKVSLKELKTRLGLIDSETGKERYTAFGLFASKVLDVAQRELAKYTELRVKYKARKTGKEYTHLEFEISCSSLVTKSGQKIIFAQRTTGEDTSNNASKDNYPHPALNGDALEQYLQLTKELRWLDKKLAYKVVTSIPSHHLWDYIYNLKLKIRAGRAFTKPKDFFKALLEKSSKKLQTIEVNKSDDRQESIPDEETTMRGVCFKKLVLEFGLDSLVVIRIGEQIAPKKLKDFLDKISEEIQHKGIAEREKSNYLLKSLQQEYQISL